MGFNRTKLLSGIGLLFGLLPGPGSSAPAANAPAPRPVPAQPPLPPVIKSPIDYFRDLLAAKPGEREKLLAGKPEDHRQVLENSIRAYEVLRPDERELRLRTMEFRFHLTSMLRTAPSNRVERLKTVPERERPLIEERLKIWDRFTPEEQKEALENERKIRVLSAVGSGSPPRPDSLTGVASNQVRQIEKQLIYWQTLPEGRRDQIQRNFNALFELTDSETIKELNPTPLSDEERALMQKSLDRFQKLSPLQRSQCVRGFDKLAALSPAERRQFLVSAQEWQKMKAEDRESWRRLVSRVPQLPPLPPGFGLPPQPPKVRLPVKPAQVATN
jgi:hypothetical protein